VGRKGDHLAIKDFRLHVYQSMFETCALSVFVDFVHLDMRSMQSVMSSEVFLNPRGDEADAMRVELSQVDLDTTGNYMALRSVYSTIMFFVLILILV
jgi:hypothetical protein